MRYHRHRASRPCTPTFDRHGDPGRTSRDALSRLERSAHRTHIERAPATCRGGELALQDPLWTLLSRQLDRDNPLDFCRERKEDQTRPGRLGVGVLRAGRASAVHNRLRARARQLAELDLAHALIDSGRLWSTSAAPPVRGQARGNRPIRTTERDLDRHDPPGRQRDRDADPRLLTESGGIRNTDRQHSGLPQSASARCSEQS